MHTTVVILHLLMDSRGFIYMYHHVTFQVTFTTIEGRIYNGRAYSVTLVEYDQWDRRLWARPTLVIE